MLGWYFWVPATPLVLYLGRRFPLERGSLTRSIPVHLATALALAVPHMMVAALAGAYWGTAKHQQVPLLEMTESLFIRHVHLDLVTYGGVLAAGYAMDYYRRYREGQLIASQLETKLVQAQLEALKMQLHPHFLFNTLHAVGVLVRKSDTKNALRMLIGLSELLRLTLDNA